MSAQQPGEEGAATDAPRAEDRRWVHFLRVVPLAVLVDQITKQVADRHLEGRVAGVHQVIEGFFMLRHSRNRGAFFSIGEALPDSVRVAFFATAALAAIAGMVWLYRSADAARRGLQAGLILLTAGAIGNLIDRLAYGEVIDFLHLHYRDVFHWATFNVADIYIAFGLALLIWDAFRAPTAGEPTEGPGTT